MIKKRKNNYYYNQENYSGLEPGKILRKVLHCMLAECRWAGTLSIGREYCTSGPKQNPYEQFLNRSIWPIGDTLIGDNTSGQSGPGSNGNEDTSKISWTGASESDAVSYQDAPFCGVEYSLSVKDTVSIFYASPTRRMFYNSGYILCMKFRCKCYSYYEKEAV